MSAVTTEELPDGRASIAGETRSKVSSLAAAATAGLVWLLAQAVAGKVISLVAQMVLARLLLPADFGVLGVALTAINIASVFCSLGVDDMLLQRRQAMRHWISPSLLVLSVVGSGAALLVAGLAEPLARFYRMTELARLLPVMGLSLLFGAVASVPYVVVRSRMRFDLLARVTVAEQLLVQGGTIGLALGGFGAMSFAWPMTVGALFRAGMLWVLAKPRLASFRRSQPRRLLVKGSAVLGSRLLAVAASQAGYVFLGYLATAAVVGNYYFAYKLAAMPVALLAGNFNSVLFPALAKLSSDAPRQVNAALSAAKMLSFLIMPCCLLQAMLARPAVIWFFGKTWADAVPVVQVLSVGVAFDAMSWMGTCLLSARGEFARTFRLNILTTALFFGFLLVGGSLAATAVGVAWAISLSYVFNGLLSSYLIFRRHGVSSSAVLLLYFQAWVAGLLAFALPAAGVELYWDRWPVISILVWPILAVVSYLAILRFVFPRVLQEITARLRDTLYPRLGRWVARTV